MCTTINNFEQFLHVFAQCAKENKNENNLELKEMDLNIEYILSTACKQGVYEIIFPYIYEYKPDIGGYDIFLNNVVRSVQRNEFMLNMIETLENANIPCCILKGISVARFYKNADYRISGDMDIYISKEHIKRCVGILKKHNFKVEPLGKMYHFEAKHPIGGLLEVHIDLHHSSSQELLFDNQHIEETFSEFLYNGRKFHTLGINDNAFYLFAHFVKHFVGFGAGIRQLMDFLLYIEYYYNDINWERLDQKLEKLRLKKMFYELLGVGVKYFNLNFCNYSAEQTQRILTDMEKGGLFGFEDLDRKYFFDAFAARRTTMTKDRFEAFMSRNRKETLLQRFFPDKEKMVRAGYRYAQNEFLLPLSWLHRFLNLSVSVILHEKSLKGMLMYETSKESNSTIEQRLKLMSDLEII